jgi:hypothetical protein
MLDINDKKYPDWIHLPRGVKDRSLWTSLHDAVMVSCESDRMNRTLSMKFRVFYLIKDKPDLIYSMKLDEVRSVRAVIWVAWPGEFNASEGITNDERSRLQNEYWAKFRDESISWDTFESSIGAGYMEVHHASLACREKIRTLRVEGFLCTDDDRGPFCVAFASFTGLEMSRSDGVEIDFEEFCRLGEAYWDAFGKRRSESDCQKRKSKK